MKHDDRVIEMLKSGGVGVLPTDTLYGVVGSALLPKTVARIYRLKKRNRKRPMIILLTSVNDLKNFGVVFAAKTKNILSQVWPGKVSVILSIAPRKKRLLRKFEYLHRGTSALAFRVPKSAWLRTLLRKTGPLVAPSANFEGEPPALTIRAARKYFAKDVDFYIDAGRLVSNPSTLIKIEKGKMFILREGAVKISNISL